MTLEQLRIFVGVAEREHMTRAAEALKVAEDRMLLGGAERTRNVDENWIREANWIVREQGSGTRSTFEEVLRHRGIDPADLSIGMTLPANEAVRSAVEAG